LYGAGEKNNFGKAVAISRDATTLVIGAPGPIFSQSQGGTQVGKVHIYYWDGSAWSQRGTTLDGLFFGDELGYSVSVSSDGTVVAMGVPYSNVPAYSGYAKVFKWTTGS
jgi:hypothetical protein